MLGRPTKPSPTRARVVNPTEGPAGQWEGRAKRYASVGWESEGGEEATSPRPAVTISRGGVRFCRRCRRTSSPPVTPAVAWKRDWHPEDHGDKADLVPPLEHAGNDRRPGFDEVRRTET